MVQNELLDGRLVTVIMADNDWATVIEAMEYLATFSFTPLDATSDELTLIADSIHDVIEDSIQDVLDGAR